MALVKTNYFWLIGTAAILTLVVNGGGDQATATVDDRHPLVSRGSLEGSEAHPATLAGSLSRSQERGIQDEEGFSRYFRPVRRVQLADSVFLRDIWSIEVSSSGRILVLEGGDPAAVFLFEPDGDFVRQLQPEVCVPDFGWRPIHAKFFDDDSILVANTGGTGGFRFDADGICEGRFDLGAVLPRSLGVGPGGQVHLLGVDYGYYLESFMPNTGVSTRHEIQTDYLEFVRYIPIGGVVAGRDGSVYLAMPYSPLVHLLSPGETQLQSLGKAPRYYRQIKEDFRGNLREIGNLMAQVRRVMNVSSYTESLRWLTEDILLLTIRNGYEDATKSERTFGYQLIHTSGRVVNQEPVFLPALDERSSVVGSRDGLVYRLMPAPSFENGAIANSNPTFEIYRFTE